MLRVTPFYVYGISNPSTGFRIRVGVFESGGTVLYGVRVYYLPVSNYWWRENTGCWLYSRYFFTVASSSLLGSHFPYIIMALEGGNSTEAT